MRAVLRAAAQRLGLVLPLAVAVMFASGWLSVPEADRRTLPLTASWGIIAAAMLVVLGLIGLRVTNRLAGALIDDTNSMSLARFQLVAWTLLVISTLLAMALVRAFTGTIADALNIQVPNELWQLLGISAASATGRELILSSKKTTPLPNASKAAMDTAQALASSGDPVPPAVIDQHRQGTVFRNPSPADASIIDMFQGDEVGNSAHVDMSKVQMFFFTIAALVAYAADVYTLLRDTTNAEALNALPPVGPGLLLILTISHATYLTNKGINHSPAG